MDSEKYAIRCMMIGDSVMEGATKAPENTGAASVESAPETKAVSHPAARPMEDESLPQTRRKRGDEGT